MGSIHAWKKSREIKEDQNRKIVQPNNQTVTELYIRVFISSQIKALLHLFIILFELRLINVVFCYTI